MGALMLETTVMVEGNGAGVNLSRWVSLLLVHVHVRYIMVSSSPTPHVTSKLDQLRISLDDPESRN